MVTGVLRFASVGAIRTNFALRALRKLRLLKGLNAPQGRVQSTGLSQPDHYANFFKICYIRYKLRG